MLVDLGRNDLERVCAPGHRRGRRVHGRARATATSCTSCRRSSATPAPGRQRLRRARRRPSRPAPSPARPKPRALELIESSSRSRRGVYGGVVGYLDFAGDLDMAIAIRTARHQGRRRPRAGRRRHRRRLGARPRVRGVRAQGRRGAARGRDRRRRCGPSRERALSSKGVVVLLALVGAGLLLVSAFRPWVTGAVDDAVLGATPDQRHRRRGRPRPDARSPWRSRAAAIAIVAAGRIARVVAVVAYALCVARRRRPRRAGAARPRGRARAGRRVAGRPHRLGRDRRRRHDLAVGGPAGLRRGPARAGRRGASASAAGAGRRSATRCRTARPPASAGPRGERVASDWDELSAGRDPTDVGPDGPT